jgi:hypothetical protein
MEVGIYTGRNKLTHIEDFRLKTILMCHYIINKFVKSSITYKKVKIDVHLKRMSKNEYGVAWPDGMHEDRVGKINKNHLRLYINSILLEDEYKFFRTLAHELVHAKQYVLKELSYREVGMVWKGIPTGYIIGKDMDWLEYYDLEWEIEAYGREEGLMVMFNLFYQQFKQEMIKDGLTS